MGISQQIGASSLIRPGVVDNTAARPASPFEGQCIFQKDTDQLLVWNGTAWVIPNQKTQNPEGLELIATVTVSAASSIPINSCFSSVYSDYLIVVSVAGSSANLRMKLRNGTTDKSATYYHGAFYFDMVAGGGVNGEGSGGTVTTGFRVGLTNTAGAITSWIKLGNPFTTGYTTLQAQPATIDGYFRLMSGFHAENYSADGVNIIPDGGTLTGYASVYGYRK